MRQCGGKVVFPCGVGGLLDSPLREYGYCGMRVWDIPVRSFWVHILLLHNKKRTSITDSSVIDTRICIAVPYNQQALPLHCFYQIHYCPEVNIHYREGDP